MGVVLGCPETIPSGPKTMVLSASLGQSESFCTFEIEVFVQPWGVGQCEEKCKQPGFPMRCFFFYLIMGC